ncbi:MAG TPA: putative lipid II flippase FtsW [Oscillatoriaceae cyanobacterium]
MSTSLPDSPLNNSLKARRAAQLDLSFLAVVLILSLGGLLTILSASAPAAQMQQHNSLFYFQRQALWCVLGFGALVLGATVKLSLLRRWSKPLMLATGVLLLATHLPGLGVSELGASRWIRLGPLSLQPSELAKLAIVVYASDLLARFGPDGWTPVQLRQILLPLGGVLGMVLFQPDLGSTIVLGATAFVLFFCNGTRLRAMAMTALAGFAGVAYMSWSTPYQRLRLLSFVNPWADPRGSGFQLVQSLMAIGSGGVLGEGWGQGKQKLFWLPIQYADFIFAAFAEEMGLIGGVCLLALFMFLAWRGFAIAGQSREPFHSLLVIGLTTTVVLQALINIGVVTASLPTTGIPLPFMSFGGTSLLATLFSMGLILNVSRNAQRQLLLVQNA